MRLTFIILIIIIWSVRVNGQISTDFNAAMLKKINQEPDQIQQNLTEAQIAGSPYLDRRFISGTIIKTDGTEITSIPLRYNVFSNTMQFKKNGTILDIYETNTIKQIILENKIFIYAPYIAAKKIRLSYFQVLNEENFQLLKMYKVVYKGFGARPEVGDSTEFERSWPAYYLRYHDGMANLIDSQKKLIKILQPIPQEIIDYIRRSNVHVNNEEELIDLLKYINGAMKRSCCGNL